jgi:peptidyl-prolyl cis-trans isomerase D
MISKMRDWAPAIMVIVLISFVIGTILLNWGANRGSGAAKSTMVGKINGRDVSYSYFDHEFNEEKKNIERGNTAHEQIPTHLLANKVWDDFVRKSLLNDFYQKAGISVTAEEIYTYFKTNPDPAAETLSIFTTNGVFDTAKYGAYFSNPALYQQNPTVRQQMKMMEQNLAERIPEQKLQWLLLSPLTPSRAELEYDYRLQHEKAVFEYAYVKAEAVRFDKPQVTDAMIKNYYAAHRDSFATSEKVDLYVVKFPRIATPRDDSNYVKELIDAKKRILADKGDRATVFGNEAKGLSDDESNAQNGGDLGWVSPGTMVPQFDSVAFKLDTDAISDPVKTQFGYHLIYVEKKEQTGKAEKTEMAGKNGKSGKTEKTGITVKIKVRHILKKIVASMETDERLRASADSLRTKLESGFVKAAAAAAKSDPSIIFDSTGLCELVNGITGIGFVPGIEKFVAEQESKKKEDEISDRLENNAGIYLFAVKQRVPKGTLPIEAAREKIVRILIDSMRLAAVQTYAQNMLKMAGEGVPLASLKQNDSLTIASGVSDTVSRVSYITGIGSDNKVTAVAFALPVGKRSGLIESNGTCFLVRPLWKGPAVTAPWGSPEMSTLSNQKFQSISRQIFTSWYLQIKNKANVTSSIDKIYID